jgi:hypothetical protein
MAIKNHSQQARSVKSRAALPNFRSPRDITIYWRPRRSEGESARILILRNAGHIGRVKY